MKSDCGNNVSILYATEKELDEQQYKYRNLQEASEKLEMELICAKSDLNGYVEKCHFRLVCDLLQSNKQYAKCACGSVK